MGGLADVRQQEWCYVAAAHSGTVGCGQAAHDGLGDGLWVGLVGYRDGVGHHHSAEQAAPPVGVKNSGRGVWMVRSDRHRQVAAPGPELGHYVGALPDDRDAERLQGLNGSGQVEDRFGSGTNHGYRQCGQRGEVGRNIAILAPVHTADPACGE